MNNLLITRIEMVGFYRKFVTKFDVHQCLCKAYDMVFFVCQTPYALQSPNRFWRTLKLLTGHRHGDKD